MLSMAWKMIWNEKSRCLITVAGVGFSVLLMLFLSGVYEGVRNGATSYVAGSRAEVWLCQQNTTNLLRSSSYWDSSLLREIRQVPGVNEAAAILRVLATASLGGDQVTLLILGFDPASKLGAPPAVARGTAAIRNGEIVVDGAFAAKYGIALAETLSIQDKDFLVAGISSGTNTVVAQFAFTTLDDSRELLGVPGLVSFCLLETDENARPDEVMDSLRDRFPRLAVFGKEEFTRNNLRELATGVLPVIGTVGVFGGTIGTLIVTLMLYGSVQEQREDYALLKAVGAHRRYLAGLVVCQSLLLAAAGFVAGLLGIRVATPVIARLIPEITLLLQWHAAAAILVLSLCIGAVGSCAPVCKLARIYPGEVFRA